MSVAFDVVVPTVGRPSLAPLVGTLRRHLPAGVAVVPCIYLAHRRPDVWPEAGAFDPTRFLGMRPNPYAFFPFGGGVRRCLGAAFATYEMKIVLATVLQNVALRLAPGTELRVVRRNITFAPSGGVPVLLESRS